MWRWSSWRRCGLRSGVRRRPARRRKADLTGYARTLPRTQAAAAAAEVPVEGTEFRGEQARREHLMTELRKARLTGIRVTVPVRSARGAPVGSACGRGGRARPDRSAVRGRAKEAVVKLVALAQALNNDYERFEALVAGEGSSG